MKLPDVTEPVRLTKGFWITCSILAVPILWISKPWAWDTPLWSRIVVTLSLPFVLALLSFACGVLLLVVLGADPRQKGILRAFVIAVMGAGVYLAFFWLCYGFKQIPVLLWYPAIPIAFQLFKSTYGKHGA